MATISTSQDYDSATRSAAETFTINSGATFTINSDTRYGKNATATTGVLGTVTVSQGKFKIDATAVRLLKFDGGASTVPAKGATLYDDTGAVTGELIGVWDTLFGVPTAAGAAMPADGYIKFKSVSAAWADNAQIRTATGGGGTQIATADGVDIVGWIEVAGVEASNISVGAGSISSFETDGAWFDVTHAKAAQTSTSGLGATQYQLPGTAAGTYHGGVMVETGAGTGVYEWWGSAGTAVGTTLAADERAKVCWIDNATGLLKFGQDWATSAVGGMIPTAGRKIRIPNIILVNTTAANYAANTLSSTFATRYDFTSATGGIFNVKYITGSWYFLIANVSGHLKYSALLDAAQLSNPVAAFDIDSVCIGPSAALSFATPFIETGSLAPSTWNDLNVFKGGAAAGSDRFATVSNNTGLTVTNSKFQSVNATGIVGVRFDSTFDSSFSNTTLIGGDFTVVVTSGCSISDTHYAQLLVGSTPGTTASNVMSLSGVSSDLVIDGIDWVTTGANTCHPYTSLISITATQNNCKIRNIGTADARLNLGTSNPTRQAILTGSSLFINQIKLDRIYTENAATGTLTVQGVQLATQASDIWGDGGDVVASAALTNGYIRGGYGTFTYSSTAYQFHFASGFTSATAGYLKVMPYGKGTIEPTASAYVLEGTAQSIGSTMFLPALNDRCTWTLPYKLRGYTGFANIAPTLSAGSFSYLTLEVSVDGGAWKEPTAGNSYLAAGGSDPVALNAAGSTVKVRLTNKLASTSVTNTGAGIITLSLVTDATSQKTQYALEEITFTDSGALADSSVAWINPGGASVFGFYNGTGTEVVYQNEDGTEKTGSYRVRKAGYDQVDGTWVETSSWYLDTKVYFVSQALKEATIADSGGVTFVGDTSATLGANKTFQQLYSNSQHWSCLESNMLYAIPVVSAGGGAYTANVDVVATGYTLNGSGSLAMGSNTLTANDSFSYTYTGGTFSQATTVPTFSGGTLNIGAAGAYTYTQAAAMILSMTPTAPGIYALGDTAFTGEVDLRNTSVTHAITVELPSGTSYTTANNTGAAISVTLPVVTADISITGMPNTVGALNRLQLINATAVTAAARANSTAYSVGDVRLRQTGIGTENTAGLYLRCTTAGTSAGTPPTWNTTVGGTTTDGTVVWTTYAILYYDADPAATSLTATYIDGEEFLEGETVEIRVAEMNGATSFQRYHSTTVASASGFTFNVVAEADTTYATYALDGSAYDTTFSPDYVASYLVLDTNTNYSGASSYSYFCYLLTTSQGMYLFWDGYTAVDPGNLRIEVDTLDMYFDESGGFVRQTDDVRIFRSDGLRPALDPTTGGNGIEINWRTPVYMVSTGGSALTATESAQLMSLPSASTIADQVVNVVTFP